MALKNDKSIDASRSEYTKLYAPTTSWGNIVAMNLGLPHIRGYWPMNSQDECNNVYDMSEQDRTLNREPHICP